MAMFTDFFLIKKRKSEIYVIKWPSGSHPVVFERGEETILLEPPSPPHTVFTDVDDHLGLISKYC